MASHEASQLFDHQDGQEFTSPHEVYQRLLQIVANESIAPEVLPYEEGIVESIVDQIQHMSNNLKRLKNKLPPFCIEQHSLELERFSFVVNRYLRTRLEKIENNSTQLISLVRTDRQKALKLMSALELKFLQVC